MTDGPPENPEERVLVLAPTARDAAATRDLLAAAGVRAHVCATIEEVCRAAAGGAGAALVTAEAVVGDAAGRLATLLRSQPPWSDLPVIVLTPPGEDTPRLLRALEAVGPTTLKKRPVQMAGLVSAVRAALRDRRRQYAVRDLLAERERAAEVLRVERERFRVTLSSIGDAVIATDTQARVTFLNPVAQALTGWDAAAALGRPLDEVFRIVDGATRRAVESPARRALREGAVGGPPGHTVLVARDGTERPVEDSTALIRGGGGGVDGAVLVFRDVTERHAAAARLLASEDRFRTTADHAPVLIWIADPTKACVWFNRPWLEFTGRTMAEECGGGSAGGIHPDDADRCRRVYVAHFDARTPYTTEYRRRRYDGEYRWLLDHGRPLAGPDGEFLGYIGSCVDITERRQAEAALRDADRRKDDFIALLAHELRNPLAPIRNGLQVLRLSDDRATRDRAREIMDRQLGHMVRLIDDLLDISRVNRNKMDLRRAAVTLADAVDNAVETARPAVEAAGHDLVVALPPEPVVLDADLTRLAQVFSNLLTNSAKYTPPGGRIRLAARRDGDEVVVSVEDTGIGIPADALPRIFDMFSQVDRSVERATGGLGIGLALVKGLVEMHGGSVTAASAGEGQGSAFAVRLPVPPAAPPAPTAAPTRAADRAGPGRRILVVDDNRDSAESMAEMLRLFGNEVALAHDGEEAVGRAGAFRPRVILMDIGMPKLNGLDATRRIRGQPWGRDVTVIALTGWGQDGDRDRTREAGCDGHLVKPVSLADLQGLLAGLDGFARERVKG